MKKIRLHAVKRKKERGVAMYHEKYRPQFHFSPKENWMNDPNGLVYYKGEYHLFFQYHPHSMVWGPMHWGHAVSKDLVSWVELPIALYPDELGQIFSGSVVVDKKNTSGFKAGEEDVMVAIFTHHGDDHEKQSIAYSNDRGRTWCKYTGNPVIQNPGLKDFRDPKVFWHEDTNQWIMSVACGDHIRFFGSPNLIDWTFLSSFGQDYGSHEGVWECPDLIQIQVENEDYQKWVLLVSINPGGPNGGSAVQYFVGDFDGKTFYCDNKKTDVNWVDFGRDFYAAVTWNNIENPILIGWMSNWLYGNEVPTDPFRGFMSIPRTLSLRNENGRLRLIQKPIDISSLYSETFLMNETLTLKHGERNEVCLSSLQTCMIGNIEKNTSSTFIMSIKGSSDRLDIIFDAKKQEVAVDRSKSGQVSFSKHFSSIDKMKVEGISNFTIIMDQTSIELFVNNGSSVMTEIFFPNDRTHKVEWRSIDGEVVLNLTAHRIKSIWSDHADRTCP